MTERERPIQNIPILSIEDYVKKTSLESEQLRWNTFLVPMEDIVLAENIRPFDWEFIDILKESIKEHGQLQECIGDVVLDGNGEYKARIIAGEHRTKAIEEINDEGEYTLVRVSLANKTLSPEEVVEIQMSENLQNKMTSAQDAVIIHNFWIRLKRIRDQESGVLTKGELARKVGRSVEVVSNAIKYIEDVNPLVQRLVDERTLSYSLALLLSGIDKGDGYESEQLNMALFFVAKSFTLSQAEKYLKKLKEEEGFSGPLFSSDEWTAMEVKNHMIAIRDESDKEGKSAAGWFVKMIRTAKVLGEPQKVRVSGAIQRSVRDLGLSLEDFEETIRPLISEREYADLFKESV